jgi:glycosyltransferase involved in cell wall biosynthesis
MVETVIDGATGLIVDKGDPRALAAAALRMLTDTAFRADVVKRGQEQVSGFDADSYVTKLEKLYGEVAAT